MGEPGKFYFSNTNPTFAVIHEKAHDAVLQEKFVVTGQGECTAAYIAGNSEGEDTLTDNPNICNWSRLYDFSRTAHRSMRSHMLRLLFDLKDASQKTHGYEIPKGMEPANGRNAKLYFKQPPHPLYTTPANKQNHLAANRYDIEWLVAHYDMLFTHYYIEKRIRATPRENIVRQLLVFDTQNHVFWNIITTLRISRIQNPQPIKVRQPDDSVKTFYNFPEVSASVAFRRYEKKVDVEWNLEDDYPPHPPDTDIEDLGKVKKEDQSEGQGKVKKEDQSEGLGKVKKEDQSDEEIEGLEKDIHGMKIGQ